MRNFTRFMLSVTAGALMASPLVACDDALDTPDTIITPDTTADTTPDVIVTKTYGAVYIQDLWDNKATNCGSTTEARMSPGADIDAIELLNGNTILGNVDTVRGVVDPDGVSKCANNAYTDFNVVKGVPDATKNFDGNYVSLEGGWLIAEFGEVGGPGKALDILVGDTLKVYELGKSSPIYAGGNDASKDEPYEVWLATDLSCVDQANPEATCMFQLSADAVGASTIPVSGF